MCLTALRPERYYWLSKEVLPLRLQSTLFAALGALLLSQFAVAGPVVWTASGISFNLTGSGSVTGSFSFDADATSFSNTSLVAGGATFTSEDYYSSAK
jgi:hypothetical protein